MPKVKDYSYLIGQRFGKLTVIEKIPVYFKGHQRITALKCLCECGNFTTALLYRLTNGRHKSCGCLVHVTNINLKTTHGQSGQPLYLTWRGIISRCYRESHDAYPLYGGRGIVMCDEWRYSFINFNNWAIANNWHRGLQVDRIDCNGNYEPLNCRIVTQRENARNKRNTYMLTYNGITKPMIEWAEVLDISQSTLINRRLRQWSDKKIIETPVRKQTCK